MKAVVMAGGFGTRIQPLTNSIPKPMLPILNKPMMEHIIRKLKATGIYDIVVLLYFKPEVIKNYFKDGEDFGVKITYVLPDDDYGTAGAVKKAEKYLDEKFIIVSGDLITDFDFKEIIGFHEAKNSKITITLTSVENPLQFGVVITNKEGKILRFLEKPGWGEVFSDTINTGIYVLEPEILKYIPENIPYDFSKDLFPKLMKEGIDLYGYNAKGYWRDVGNPESYREVYQDIFNGKVKIMINGEKIERDKGVIYKEEGSYIPENVNIKGTVVLGKNVKIEENTSLENVCIGDNTVISKGSKLKNGVIWWSSEIGKRNRFTNFVICNDVKTGKNVKADKGVVIAEKVKIEDNVIFDKDVIIWPNKFIEENSIVSSNLIWGEKWKRSVFEGGKVVGRTNIELSCEMAAKLAEAFGSVIPKGSTVYVSRDYHRASRMIKRAFLGGLLSTGLDVVDLKLTPLPITRFSLTKSKKVAGIHFRQSHSNPLYTEILFYDSEGMPIDANTEKGIERIFFRENFRRVNVSDVGIIKEKNNEFEHYAEKFMENIDVYTIQSSKFKVAVDLLNGSTSIKFPEILNHLNINNIILNAYFDEKKLTSIPILKKQAIEDVSKIVKSLEMDLGVILFPDGEKVKFICDNGIVIPGYLTVLMFLLLIDKTIDKQVKVYLPVSVPDILDSLLENIIVERGKTIGLKASFLRDYYFFANLEGSYSFINFSYSPDAMFSAVKLIEMLIKAKTTATKVLKEIPEFSFKHITIGCPSNLKGKIMRKFTEEAVDKEASFVDGVKIFLGKGSWVLMIPDQYSDNIHIYVQSLTEEEVNRILDEYKTKVNSWINEN